ncbi:hypothetical protein EGW08_018483 [Elysia chlorotica]|uniref:Sulfotransferase domain-containing protein n=1 Tax=Elysia chlorotica TaxID=188477 RepID=A0A433SWR7_ELYCH|nr:hypothetical protein EGW08_018483 [Elysia chlorotica]
MIPHDDIASSLPPSLTHSLCCRFSREMLRLTFKPLPVLDAVNRTRDISDEFPCQQSWDALQTLGANDTEDIMCIPRPKFLPHLQNPCYTAETKPGARRSNTVHCLPYFHILGNDKCGTTDFHARLTQHPRVLPNNGGIGKEVYYWCWHRYGLWMKKTIPKKRFHIYHMFFQVPANLIVNEYRKNKVQYITGDGTPMDFWDFRGWPQDPQNAGLSEPRFLTPHAMRHLYRDPRFIVMVRDPIDRQSDRGGGGEGREPGEEARDCAEEEGGPHVRGDARAPGGVLRSIQPRPGRSTGGRQVSVEGQGVEGRQVSVEGQRVEGRQVSVEGQRVEGRQVSVEGQRVEGRQVSVEGQRVEGRHGGTEGRRTTGFCGGTEGRRTTWRDRG